MGNLSALKRTHIRIDEKVRVNSRRINHFQKKSNSNPLTGNIDSQYQDDFSSYLNLLGLANEQGLLMLPSGKHYYYDIEEFNSVKILVNEKKLNQITQLNDFLSVVQTPRQGW